ncbi:hypothetical protein BSZ07_19450 [Streptomyces sp. M1013]|uniref:DUF262 domain-containing protein n=1 Tax=Streptomyces sp. M1013 TaxID=549798 RepID=UPI000978EC20|nr:DUF262 domain-containing protein [Streptomyces sp. M1013]OMI88191.1 hypothetical protein BSZ07_19450 [Streptomyces sp. M1013]
MSDPKAMQAQLETQRRKIDVDNYTITVRELLSMAERSELKRAPEYQRKFRWDEEAESRLIESILLGLPVPSLFFATNDDGSWEVVDGLQRISTLIHFASDSEAQLAEIKKDSPLVLRDLKELDKFNGLTYEDLPPAMKFTFTKRGLGVTALSDKSDPQIRFDTFERLNRGSVELSKQEVRACIYEGKFNKLIRELAETTDFKNLVKLQKKNEENATREELVLKFFAYLNNRSAFTGAVHDFLNAYMEANRHSFNVKEGRAIFTRTVGEILSLTQGPLLRSNTNVTPQNELEAVMIACAELLEEGGGVGTPPAGWLDDRQLVSASTGATNTRTKLRDRIARAKELLTPEA